MNFGYLKQEIDYELGKIFSDKHGLNTIVYDAMNYSLKNGGKRIRPILFLYTYGLFKDDYKDLIKFSCYIEMIHTYSLIHDDLPCMDNDMLRRGNLSNHLKYSESIALLAGDGLLTESFKNMLEYSIKYGMEYLYASFIIAKSVDCDGMIGGQVADILTKGKGRELTSETLDYINKNKTASFIKACVLAGAYIGGANEEEINKLSKYGHNIGMVFQIIDDILDRTSTADTLGKGINSDERNNKFTYFDLYGIEECKNICENYNNEALKILNSLDRDVSNLVEFTKYMLHRNF